MTADEFFAIFPAGSSQSALSAMLEAFDGYVCYSSPELDVKFINTRLHQEVGRPRSGIKCHELLHGALQPCAWCQLDKVQRGEIVRQEVESPRDRQWYRVVHAPVREADGRISVLTLAQNITDSRETALRTRQLNSELELKNQVLTAEVRERQRAEEALLQAHRELEQRIQERTAQLSKANEQLRREIGSRQQIEAALIRAERLAAVGELAGGVAHEFNNINTSVLGFSELLLGDGQHSAETRDCLLRIRKAALRAKSITSSLLTFAGKGVSDFALANLALVLRESLALVSRDLETNGIEVRTELDTSITLPLDPSQIGQVALNLLLNAQHALLDRSEKRIEVRSWSEAEHACFSVTDTGCGIPEEHLGKIFSPFFSTKGEHSLGDSSQAAVRGTGLGLSVSQTIIDNHGGRILVESQPGRGSTFTVRLPLKRAESIIRRAPPGPAVTRELPGGRIMVLDDEEETRDLLQIYLRRHGFEVYCQDEGERALELASEKAFDLVLVDLQMPRMTGLEFIRRLQKLTPEAAPQFLVITGKPLPSETEELQALGVPDIVFKPFSLDEIMRRIVALLAKRPTA